MEVIVEKPVKPMKPGLAGMIFGAILIIVGALFIVFQRSALEAVLMVFGVLVLLFGLVQTYLNASRINTVGLLIGLVMVVIGIALIACPNLFSGAMMLVLAIVLIVTGAMSVIGFSMEQGPSRWLSLFVGVILVVVGIYAAMNLNSTADIVMIVIGVAMLLSGLIGLASSYTVYRF
ncbi:MAG: DUF308 domain-containing protein [Candidatus Methanomethylophilaceae archaeon]|nr:DUF308 domain-containing protein [Candidatus Methanomethylophilaceae archaeon]